MPVGYQNSSGVDLDDIFEARNSEVDGLVAGNTGYQRAFDELDLRYLYAPASAGSIPSANTGYQLADGTDLRHLFCAKGARTLMSAVVSPSSAEGSASSNVEAQDGTSNAVTCTVSNNWGAVSYSWTRDSGSTFIGVNSATASTTTFNCPSGLGKGQYTAVFRCTATDQISSAYDTVEVTFTVV